MNFGVLVMNTNYKDPDTGKPINGSKNPEEHANTVWKEFVQKTKAKVRYIFCKTFLFVSFYRLIFFLSSSFQHIAVVPHSYGGIVTVELARNFRDDFLERVFSILKGCLDSRQERALCDRIESAIMIKYNRGRKSDEISIVD